MTPRGSGDQPPANANVSAFTYRAFISYSHRDANVAKWLHNELESYRVPTRLIGRETTTGVIGESVVYATGLRNPIGMTWGPKGALWTVVNERDKIGNDLVPDYMTAVQPGAFYGWPYSYYGRNVDTRVKSQDPELVEKAVVPDYGLGAHTASIGIHYYSTRSGGLPKSYQGGVFVTQRGSWNRRPVAGYRVIFVPFDGDRPDPDPRHIKEVLTGFLDQNGDARGRPIGITEYGDGDILISDDVGKVIWKVSATASGGMAMAAPQ